MGSLISPLRAVRDPRSFLSPEPSIGLTQTILSSDIE